MATQIKSRQTAGPCGFQAIILAGFGTGLYPLTEANNLPKALLPIANKPMIWYVLKWCEEAGFLSVMVICQTQVESCLSSYLRNVYDGHIRVQVYALSGVDDVLGTADVIRKIHDKIKSDFIILSCDLIMNLPPHEILDFHRIHTPTVTFLLYDISKDENFIISKDSDRKMFFGINKSDNSLVFVKSEGEVNEEFIVRMSMLWKYPRIYVTSTLRDSHLYIFKRWVLDLIVQNERISSIQEDLIPLLLKFQYQSLLLKRYNIKELCSRNYGYNLGSDSLDEKPVRVISYLLPDNRYCLRSNTIQAYTDLNRNLSKISAEPRVCTTAKMAQKVIIGADSLVGENTKIDERCNVKKSVIGANCILGKSVTVVNSIIMNNVKIEDSVRLDGCIVCVNSVIGAKSKLKNCCISGGYEVPSETCARNDNLIVFDGI
ncbi:hypothetical protein T552_00377 [Pneumocystis carinii B80]|uniref:Translation initiation factor eIF2B subunit gamma n=1 Tax=Pneumocystis carinii (strain B80) TaxID=1408658 RepID=A0A0W4ZQL4_PNEC8|nr:hypothetical protein T552_00377 [Pneumocystis carinii B80]KTW30662.1 hypothetical protein T552_00377 [Pneumocystis carinii B80]